ncbi:MAG: 4Fe-4S dicluster domain-containing protein [Candidatus Micrarchaeota archaeon]|nr:4Fe-4S dicluster domain-containing protein [Candidatus Micrarchaeota archaeon]
MGVAIEVLKRLVSRPVTTKYPDAPPETPEGLRGKVEWNRETCIWCKMCEMNCPANAISIDKEKKIWSIDTAKCIFCGRCNEVCPTKPKSVYLTKKIELATERKENLRDVYEEHHSQEKGQKEQKT